MIHVEYLAIETGKYRKNINRNASPVLSVNIQSAKHVFSPNRFSSKLSCMCGREGFDI
jgi:hypothetical protein